MNQAEVVADQIQTLTPTADDVVVWVVLGLAFLWLISSMAEVTLVKLRPVLMFLVVAAFAGVLVTHMVAKL